MPGQPFAHSVYLYKGTNQDQCSLRKITFVLSFNLSGLRLYTNFFLGDGEKALSLYIRRVELGKKRCL